MILKTGGLLIFGALLILLGIRGWMHRGEDRISAIELVVLGDQKPMPFTKVDRALAYIQPILFLILGPMMILSSAAILMTTGETQ